MIRLFGLFLLLLLLLSCSSSKKVLAEKSGQKPPCKLVDKYGDTIDHMTLQYVYALNTMLSIDSSRDGIYFYYMPSFEKEQVVVICFKDSSAVITMPKDSSVWSIISNIPENRNAYNSTLFLNNIKPIHVIQDTQKVVDAGILETIGNLKSIFRQCDSISGSHVYSLDGTSYIIVLRNGNNVNIIGFSDENYDDKRYNLLIQWYRKYLFIDSNGIHKMIWNKSN
jgi:hypothetical protein